MSYLKIQPDDPSFNYIERWKSLGQWVCDSVDHHEPEGCSNPRCFKFPMPTDCACGGTWIWNPELKQWGCNKCQAVIE